MQLLAKLVCTSAPSHLCRCDLIQFEDMYDMFDLKLHGMGISAVVRPKALRVNKDSTIVAPVAVEQPHHGKEEEKARSGSCDDEKNKEGQAGGQHVGSQSFMQHVSICTIRLKSYGPSIAIWTTCRCIASCHWVMGSCFGWNYSGIQSAHVYTHACCHQKHVPRCCCSC